MNDFEKAEKFVEMARESISIVFPLFSRILFDTEFVANESIPTLRTDGNTVEYNPAFILEQPSKYHMFFMLHELAHIFLGHCVRFNKAYHTDDDFQLAADYVTNALLMEAGVKLWPNAYYEHKFREMSLEEVYEIIHEDPKEQFDDQSHGKIDESPDTEEDDDDTEDSCGGEQLQGSQKRQQAIAKSEDQMREAMQSAKMSGNLPASLERYLNDMHKPENNWQDILAEVMIRTKGLDDYTYSRVNRRHTGGEFMLPGLFSEECETIAMAVDTSGSISQAELTGMASEVIGLMEDAAPEELIVMSCDHSVKSYQRFTNGDASTLDLRGGGGTDFVPPFVRLEKEDVTPDMMIYLTDGYCSSFPQEPPYPVIWVVWQDRHVFIPPFGEVVVMEGRK